MLTIVHIEAIIISQVSLKVKVNTLGIEQALLWTNQFRFELLLYLDGENSYINYTTAL